MDIQDLTPAQEDYLKVIHEIASANGGGMRAKDIAAHIGVRTASITSALKILAAHGLINYAPYEALTLTPKGEARASGIRRNYVVLRDFCRTVLGVVDESADAAACGMEHIITIPVLERIQLLVLFAQKCPIQSTMNNERLLSMCANDPDPSRCQRCIGECAGKIPQDETPPSSPQPELAPLCEAHEGQTVRIMRMKDGIDRIQRIDALGLEVGGLARVVRPYQGGSMTLNSRDKIVRLTAGVAEHIMARLL